MKTRITITVCALLLSPVVAYLSGFVPVWVDFSTRETVGVTFYRGFPIPFYRSAEGISILGGWIPMNFWPNIALWTIMLPAISLFIHERRKKKNGAQPAATDNDPQLPVFE